MLKRISNKLEKTFMAIAFAEAGEHETALEIIREKDTDAMGKSGPVLEKANMQVQIAGMEE